MNKKIGMLCGLMGAYRDLFKGTDVEDFNALEKLMQKHYKNEEMQEVIDNFLEFQV